MSKRCAKCEKTVYPVEELKCLEKIWHKTCFKCQVCNMTLSMKNYKGFDKLPYCGAHVPKAKATVVADTPENKRLAENSKTQSNVKYHAEFEASRGKFTQIADDPETLRIKANTDVISNVAYHDVKGQREDQEKKRSLQGGGENTNKTPEPGFKTPEPPEEREPARSAVMAAVPAVQPGPPGPARTAAAYNSAHQPTSRSTPSQPPPYSGPPQQYHTTAQYQQQQQQLYQQQQQQQQQLYQQQQQQLRQQQQQLKQQQLQQQQYAQQQRQAQMYQQQQQQQSRNHQQQQQQHYQQQQQYQQKAAGQYGQMQYHQQTNNGSGAGYGGPGRGSAQPAPTHPSGRSSQSNRCYKAMYDYESQDVDEVSFRDGDIIINATFIDEGWMTGTVHRTGQAGMLPANYVEPVNL